MRKGTSGQRQKKSVTTLLEGRTPVKSRSYVSDDPPSRLAKKTVSTTIDGMTPKKERYYDKDEAPSMTMPVSPWTKPTTSVSSNNKPSLSSPSLSYSPSSSSTSPSSPPTAFEFDPFSSIKRKDFNSTQRSDFFQLSDDFLAEVESLDLPSPPPIKISKSNSIAAPFPASYLPGSPEERPKTSRREPNPSPEKFTDYVIPTPEKQSGEDSFNDRAPAMFAIYLLGLTM